MVGTTMAVLGAAGIGANLFGGLFGSHKANQSANTLAQAAQATIPVTQKAVTDAQTGVTSATNDANAALAGAGDKAIALLQPYIDSGQLTFQQAVQMATDPNGPFAGEFKFDRSMLDNEPGYQFAKEQGGNAVNSSNAARGRLLSGAAVKDLAGYTTGLADQYYNSAFDRAMQAFQANRNAAGQRFGNLMNLAGVGYGAAQDSGNTGMAVAGAVGNNKMNAAQLNGGFGLQGAQLINEATTGAANAKASGQVASGNSWSQAFQNAGNGIMDFLAQRKAASARPANPVMPVIPFQPNYGYGIPG